MQTTFRLNANEIDYNFFETVKKLFKNKTVTITVQESVEDKTFSTQQEHWIRLEALHKKYPPKVISKDIDLSALANEVNL